jgi:hypothetical protein
MCNVLGPEFELYYDAQSLERQSRRIRRSLLLLNGDGNRMATDPNDSGI